MKHSAIERDTRWKSFAASIDRMLDHVAIEVGDLDGSVGLFCRELGLTCKRVGSLIGGKGERVALLAAASGYKIELIESTRSTPGLGHLAFRTSDLDGRFAALVDGGCRPLSQPMRLEPARARSALVETPDGLRIQLIDYDADSPDL